MVRITYTLPSVRALRNYDLLHTIFSFLDKATLANCATVNKQWNDFALDYLYRSIYDEDLVSTLAPTIYTRAFGQMYTVLKRPFGELRWDRFRMYAGRIREIDCQNPWVAAGILDAISANVNSSHFSRLTSVKIALPCPMAYAEMFMQFLTEKVENVTFYTTHEQDCYEWLFDEVTKRAPKVKSLRVETNPRVKEYNNLPTPATISKLRHLTSLSLTGFPCSISMLREFSKLPCLENIELRPFDSKPVKLIPWTDDMFPSLKGINIYTDLEELIDNDWFPASLHRLDSRWRTLRNIKIIFPKYNAAGIQECLSRIATTCPQLEKLTIMPLSFAKNDTNILTLDDILPISSMKKLKELFIRAPSFQMGDTEVADLVKILPELTSLELTSFDICRRIFKRPSDADITTLTPALLPRLAKVRPNMTRLSLYLDATEVPKIPRNLSRSRFTNMNTIDFGSSPCVASIKLGNLLAKTIPHPHNLEHDNCLQYAKDWNKTILRAGKKALLASRRGRS